MLTKLASFLALGLAVTTSVSAQSTCPEAARFGNFAISPDTITLGQTSLTVTANFSCSVTKGIHPKFTDFYITVPEASNNGHQPPLLLARKEYQDDGTHVQTFTVDASEFDTDYPGWVNGSPYVAKMYITYPLDGFEHTSAFIEADSKAITITNPAN